MKAEPSTGEQWFVMRDLKRANAKLPAYKQLQEAGFRVFTPMTTKVIEKGGKKTRIQVPFVQDLLFVYSGKEALDNVVSRTKTLQYRYLKGAAYCTPMTVPAPEMDKFISAVTSVKTPQYYHLDEITPGMYGAKVRMICQGPLNGYEGTLLKIKGSGKKRLLIKLPGVLAASVEIGNTDYIQLLTP